MIRLAIAIAALLMFAPFLAPPAFAPSAFAPSAFAEDAAPPSDARMAAAIEMVEASNVTAHALDLINKMIPGLSERVHRQNPNMDEETLTAFMAAIQAQMSSSAGDYTKVIAEIYAKRFSEDELHNLAQFFRSDVGQKYVAQTPDMASDIQRASVAWVGSAVMKATKTAGQQFKDKGLNL